METHTFKIKSKFQVKIHLSCLFEKKISFWGKRVLVGLVTFSMRNNSVLIQPNYWNAKKDQRNLNSINPKFLKFLQFLQFTRKNKEVHAHMHKCALSNLQVSV